MHSLGYVGQTVVEVLDACKHVGVIRHHDLLSANATCKEEGAGSNGRGPKGKETPLEHGKLHQELGNMFQDLIILSCHL